MSGMWRRWARVRRLIGLTYLTIAAVALAIAVLVFTLGYGIVAGTLTGISIMFTAAAAIEFFMAAKYIRIERNHS